MDQVNGTMMDNLPTKDRGTFLAVLFVFSALGILSWLIELPLLPRIGLVTPTWVFETSIGIILQVVALYGIWKWQKWGIYLLGLAFVAVFVVQKTYEWGPFMIASFVIPALWFWALYRKRTYFK